MALNGTINIKRTFISLCHLSHVKLLTLGSRDSLICGIITQFLVGVAVYIIVMYLRTNAGLYAGLGKRGL